MRRVIVSMFLALVVLTGCRGGNSQPAEQTSSPQGAGAAPRSGYASIGPLRMYYEVHGAGEPVLLIHGGVSTIDTSFGTILPELSKRRQVIAIESQGHGHTADVDRPLTFEQMGDDAAALLRHLQIPRADVVGYSDGGNVALALAMRHSALVRKIVVMATNYNNDGLTPEVRGLMEKAASASEAEVIKNVPPRYSKAYADVAPQPSNWPKLVSKVMKQGTAFPGWTPDQVRSIAAPTLIVLADRDIVTPEHAAAMFRLHKQAQLAVVPGRDHFTLVEQSAPLLPMLNEFLSAPMPSPATPGADARAR
jgi:pimeloyl-ACP methyl ester carboxylesterase